MNRRVFEKILAAQEALYKDSRYRELLVEYEQRNAHFMRQIETMTPEQQSAVWDYCGLLIEMHLHTLEIVAS